MVAGHLQFLSYNVFLSKLRQILSLLGYNPSSYAGHSFRRGGASWAYQSGVRTELIKLQGDWKSEVYQKYLELPLQSRVSLAMAMSKNL